MQTHLKIDLNGSFHLEDEDGNEITISSARGRALLAILVTSKGYKRSRDFLKSMLWPRSAEQQASNSLRNLLHTLRKELGDAAGHLIADRAHVSLENAQSAPSSNHTGDLWFEDAPNLGVEFDNWLCLMRSSQTAQTSNLVIPTSERPPAAIMCAPAVLGDDLHASIVAQTLCDQIIANIRTQEMIDIYDFRDLNSNQIQNEENSSDIPGAVLIKIQLIKVGAFAKVSVQLQDADTQRVLWNATIAADQSSSFLLDPDQLFEFGNQAVDAIHTSLLRVRGGYGQTSTLFVAVHQIMSLSPDGQKAARTLLARKELPEQSGVAAAWYAFSFANSLGECDPSMQQAYLEEAEHYCARALEMEPTNPIVLALVAHVMGFVLRNLEVAAAYCKLARQAGPSTPLVWDMSAMNAHYSNQPDNALKYAQKASRLGRFSPYKPLFDSSLAIGATGAGQHNLAIKAGNQVLARWPGFLAVMRHLFASYAAMGRMDEASKIAEMIRRRDPGFTEANLGGPDRPFLAESTEYLIKQAFKKTQITS